MSSGIKVGTIHYTMSSQGIPPFFILEWRNIMQCTEENKNARA